MMIKKWIFLLALVSVSAHAKNILFLGDSLSSSSPFGKKMAKFLKNPTNYCKNDLRSRGSHSVWAYARPSSATKHWVAGEEFQESKDWLCERVKIHVNGTASRNLTKGEICKGSGNQSIFEKLVNKHNPDTFVIALGTNSMAYSERFTKSKIKLMLNQMPSGSRCFWITPPYARERYIKGMRKVERYTKEVLKSYKRIKCTPVTTINELRSLVEKKKKCHKSGKERFTGDDGLHHTYCGSTLWADSVIKKMCQSL